MNAVNAAVEPVEPVEPAEPVVPVAVPDVPEAGTLHGCPFGESLGAAVVHCNRDRYLDLWRRSRPTATTCYRSE
jgi:hypothetical protein